MSPTLGTYDDDADGPSAAIANEDESDFGSPATPAERSDADVLDEIRERRTYANRAWEEIRKEGQKDMRYGAGDPWVVGEELIEFRVGGDEGHV